MYLVDTSVWIDYFRERSNPAVEQFEGILDRQLPFGITGVILQEVLQGAETDRDFDVLEQYLCTQHFYHAKDPLGTYRDAAHLYYRCRRRGVTVRGTLDCFIAQIAIEHDLVLLHNDRDFTQMATVVAELTLA